MLRKYYHLTKPGIIYGNIMTAIAGFLLASRGSIDPLLLVSMMFGLALVIASSCVFNNYIDRDIDIAMERTESRALVKGSISAQNALIFASMLGIIGILILAVFTNVLTLVIALIGAIVYILFYTPIKRHSIYSTLVGSISGAAPIVAGYTAVTHMFDTGAFILFLIMVIWQMPHFYAIAIFRIEEYRKAGIPLLSVVKGTQITKIHIVAYVFFYIIAIQLLTFFGFAGYTYGVIMGIVGLLWLGRGLTGFGKGIDEKKWARKMFFFSLIVLCLFSITISLDSFLL